MLVEDRTAFVEQLDVQQPDRRGQKRRRRLVLADLDVMRLEVEVRLADERASRDGERALRQP